MKLESLALAAQRKMITAHEAIFYQGDIADSIILIKSGRVKLSKVLEDGTEILLKVWLLFSIYPDQTDQMITDD